MDPNREHNLHLASSKSTRGDEDASGEGMKEGIEGNNEQPSKEEFLSISCPQSAIDKSTDTASSHKLYALNVALITAIIEDAKQKYDKIFNQVELKFFEKLFRIANIAQDGLLNESELMFFLDQHDYIISKQEARQIIKESDLDKDGALDFGEFLGLCQRANINLQGIGILSEDWEHQLQNSVKIRNLFQQIFDAINLAPSIQETVEYFENKIAETAVHHCKSSVQDFDDKVLDKIVVGRRGGLGGTATTTQIIRDEGLTTEENHHDLYDDDDDDDDHVHSEYDFDLIVLGNGAGGNSVAKEAAKVGKKVAICDSSSSRFASSCINVGCVPKMLMNHACTVGDMVDKRTSLPFGWFPPPEPEVVVAEGNTKPEEKSKAFSNDWTTLIDNIQNYIRTLNFEQQFGLEHYKLIKYYNLNCEFDAPHRIKLTHEDKTTEFITGEKIVIAVGSNYRYLDIPGAHGNCITIDDIFSMRRYPGRVLIVGGGEDAIECAGLLCGLQLEVTIMSRSPVLKGFDRRMATLILETLHSRGIKIMIGWSPVEICSEAYNLVGMEHFRTKKKLIVGAKHVQTGERCNKEFDTIVLAIGRKPATPLLKLKKAEVLIEDETSKIWVDSQDMTTSEDVFAIGDCASQRVPNSSTLINFSGLSYQAGLKLSRRLYHGSYDAMEYDQAMPKLLLTYPHAYACVGLSEEAAIVEHGETNIEVYYSRCIPLQYQLGNRHKGICYAKMITLKSEDERIVGLHYLGPNAGDLMQGYVLAVKLGAKKADMDSMIAMHPTSAEIFSRMSKTLEESDFVTNSAG